MDFLYGRESLMASLWEHLERRSLILSGPRRVGKSTMLDHMARNPAPDWRLLRIDMQGAATLEEGLERIAEALPKSRGVEVKAALDRVEEAAGVKLSARAQPDAWRAFEGRLREAARTLPPNERLVLALDEVPFWLDEVERRADGAARHSLAQLRRYAQDAGLARLRWIFTGSVGLAGRAISWSAAAELNDLDIVQVPPLDVAAGCTLFEMTFGGRRIKVQPEAAQLAHQQAGGRPHWIKLLAERCTPQGGQITPSSVNEAEQTLLSRPMRHIFRDEGRDHFSRTANSLDTEVMAAILSACAAAEGPLPRQGLLTVGMAVEVSGTRHNRRSVDDLLLRLVDEYYLEERDLDALVMALPLFGRWWTLWGDVR